MRPFVRKILDEWEELIKPQNLPELHQRLNPVVLFRLNPEEMEGLLNKLPQVGVIKGRAFNTLRIMSVGYHVHIQGVDQRAPYPVDFFVRAGGILSSVNLVLRIDPDRIPYGLLPDADIGSDYDLLDALHWLYKAGIALGGGGLELVQQLQFRPCVPNARHWTSPGGNRPIGESISDHSLRELHEEAAGLTVIASRELLRSREYKGGNIPEFHSVTGVLCVGEPHLSDEARQEGIGRYRFIPTCAACEWFDRECARDLDDPECNLPGGKTEHALLKLFYLCEQAGIAC